jgi:hypothetical protein
MPSCDDYSIVVSEHEREQTHVVALIDLVGETERDSAWP